MQKFLSFLVCMIIMFSTVTENAYADEDTITDIPLSEKSITIFNTNDINSYIEDDSNTGNIGLAKVMGLYNVLEGDILLDSGNIFFGQANSYIDKGTAVAETLASMNYTAVGSSIGDLYYGAERLKELSQLSATDFIGSNIFYSATNENLFGQEYKIVEIDGIKIGIFSVIDDDYYYSLGNGLLNNVVFYDEVEYANKISLSLKENELCDFVICMANLYDYKDFGEKVSNIDLVLLSTSDKESINYKTENTLFVSCADNLKEVGVTTVSFSLSEEGKKDIINISNTLYSYDKLNNIENDEFILSSYDSAKLKQNSYFNTVIANADTYLDGTSDIINYTQTNMGALVTNAYIEFTGADIALELSSNIKLSIGKGDVTISQAINIISKEEYIVTKEMSGQEILDTLELMVDMALKNKNFYNGDTLGKANYPLNYMQFGGMKVYYNKDNLFGRRVTLVRIKNEQINLSGIYKVAMSSTLSECSDFSIIASKTVREKYGTAGEAIFNYIKSNGLPSSLNSTRYVQEETPIEVPENPSVTNTGDNSSYSYIAYILIAALLASAIGSVYLKKKSISKNNK